MSTNLEQNKNTVQDHLVNLHGKCIYFKKDEIIYKPGDIAEDFYLVLEGTVELTHKADTDHSFVKVFNKNQFFGLDDFIKKTKRTLTAKAKDDTEVFQISFHISENKQPELQNIEKSIHLNEQLTSVTRLSSLQTLVAVNNIDDIKLITFYGQRANLNNAIFFKNFLFELIAQGNNKLIVDLSACNTIDSTFLGSLIAVLKKVSVLGGRLSMICNSDICSWLFVMTKMDKVFDIHQTLNDAVSSINKNG